MYDIEIENVTKTYKMYKKSSDRIVDAILGTKRYKEHKALSSLNLKIEKGEAVGILGKNGAGKSTLLKILTGVVTPTEGSVNVRGSIAAILELNSGFDEEFSGRENIYLKGTLLGYNKAYIDSKVNDIMEFAGLGDYIDRPVRTYSSGMKSRLGFAIAVSVEPDVLIVDEALSVGDDIFKTKCLKKMSEFRAEGKTILFVSHSLFTIKSFCTKCAWIKDGELMSYGGMGEVVQMYESFLKEEKAKENKKDREASSKEEKLERKDYINATALKLGEDKGNYSFGEDMRISFNYEVKKQLKGLRWTITIRDMDNKEIFSSNKLDDKYLIDSSIGKHKMAIVLKNIQLLPGKYKLSGELRDSTGIIYVGYANKKEFTVTSKSGYLGSGVVYIEHSKE